MNLQNAAARAHTTIRLAGQSKQLANLYSLEHYSVPPFVTAALSEMEESNYPYKFLVLTGPSGVGKSHTIADMVDNCIGGIDWRLVKRVTTRPRRSSETNDELIFITNEEFRQLEVENGLLYCKTYGGNSAMYGTPTSHLLDAISKSTPQTVLIITGTIALTQILPNCACVYLVPPSVCELRKRIAAAAKPGAHGLISYDIQEMYALLSFVPDSTYAESHQISIICNDTDKESDCIRKIVDTVVNGQRTMEIPKLLLRELMNLCQTRNLNQGANTAPGT